MGELVSFLVFAAVAAAFSYVFSPKVRAFVDRAVARLRRK